MSARQRPPGRCVVEGGTVPIGSRVTDLALLRKPGCGVIRIVGTLKILQVAANTCGGGKTVIAIGMALRALHAHVCAR